MSCKKNMGVFIIFMGYCLFLIFKMGFTREERAYGRSRSEEILSVLVS
uniref:Uncharacterized protein n=1 Tax=Nelumbo nucifera TaxID=4432 RepID=A0A822ZJ33_NELNU|nr:TPA_asm: hypothetical protein HUJ06_001868 [Nelumbo nucifera]DAD43641.1 TPA_asm: hypothetical protein HUJ06_001871 [Nelumbo nucifera]